MDTLKEESATSLLELLLALSLFAACSILLLPAAKSALAVRSTVRTHAELSNRAAITFATIEQALNGSKLVPALNPVRIHLGGRITMADGASHPVHTSTSRLRPGTTSAAISFLIIEPTAIHKVVDGSRSGSAIQFSSCNQTERITGVIDGTETPEHWLAISLDGYAPIDGKPRVVGGAHSSCPGGKLYRGSYSFDERAMFGFNRAPAEIRREDLIDNAKLLIGVRESFTLYVDESQTLRRLSHTSSENQPVRYEIDRLEILTQPAFEGTKNVELKLNLREEKTGRTKTFSHYATWRGEGWNDLADLMM